VRAAHWGYQQTLVAPPGASVKSERKYEGAADLHRGQGGDGREDQKETGDE
jgi:hypothetical protein